MLREVRCILFAHFQLCVLKGVKLIAMEEVRNYGKIVSYSVVHQKHFWSLAYFSHLAPLVLFFLTKRQIQKGGFGTMAPKYAPGRTI